MLRDVSKLALFFSLLLGTATGAYAADGCKPVYDALIKIVTTPSHSYSSQTTGSSNGKTRSVETIYVQGKTYMRSNGKWMVSPVKTSEVVEAEEENRKAGKGTCQFVRNESLTGETAAVYSMRRETENGKEDGLIWISTSTGLALRREVDLDTGGTMGKSHLSSRTEYSHVIPPI